jgi:hypothetical protein
VKNLSVGTKRESVILLVITPFILSPRPVARIMNGITTSVSSHHLLIAVFSFLCLAWE